MPRRSTPMTGVSGESRGSNSKSNSGEMPRRWTSRRSSLQSSANAGAVIAGMLSLKPAISRWLFGTGSSTSAAPAPGVAGVSSTTVAGVAPEPSGVAESTPLQPARPAAAPAESHRR